MPLHVLGRNCSECGNGLALLNGVEAGHKKDCSKHTEGFP